MILNRYFLKDIFLYTAAVSFIFLLIVVSSRSIQYLEQAAVGEINPEVVAWVILYRLPEFFQLILPLSFFLSLVLTVGKFSANNELNIYEQNGFTVRRLIAISLIPASLVAVVSMCLSIWISPESNIRASQLLEEQSFQDKFRSIQPGSFHRLNEDLLIYAKKREGRILKSVFIQTNPKKQTNTGTIVTADSASLDITNPNILLLNEGNLYFKQKDYQSSRMSFEELQMNIEASPPIKVLDKITEKTSIQSKFQWSISLGLMSLIAVLLAIPVSKVPPREGRYKRVLPAVFIFIFYLGLLITIRGWLETGIIQAFPGMYSVHLIFMVLGLFLLNRADSFKN
jgi:lipopolysaccharide export system permease protein